MAQKGSQTLKGRGVEDPLPFYFLKKSAAVETELLGI
jgi:hypothetical protein